jgi:hypothetical protein
LFLLYIATPITSIIFTISTISSIISCTNLSITIITTIIPFLVIAYNIIWLLIITIVTILYIYNPDTFRENSIIKFYISIYSIRSSYYINFSLLNKKSINIELLLYKDLTNYNIIWINNFILARKSKSLLLLIIIVLYSS